MFPREQLKKAADIRLSLANNLAATSLKCEQWSMAVQYANRALDVDPDNAKAIYRRGQGHL